MGCFSSKKDLSREKGSGSKSGGSVLDGSLTKTGGRHSTTANGAGRQANWTKCHFCGKNIPEKEYNCHTVTCDEREMTCTNTWCRQIVKQGMMQKHQDECFKKQRAMCVKCGADLLVSEMTTHRDTCQPTHCSSCGEKCIARIMKWCPDNHFTRAQITNGPFATDTLMQKYSKGHSKPLLANTNFNVARIQLLWRWIKAKSIIEETIFRVTYKEMDLKKEGFAIFKAHDRGADTHLLVPRRSRSVLQVPVVPPTISSHYFPTLSTDPITIEHVQHLIKDISEHILLPYPAAWRVFKDTEIHLRTMPTVVRLSPPIGARVSNGRVNQGSNVVVVGDLHGQLADLLHILKECGMPNEGTYYIFNGDFVDRGARGVEVLLVLFSLMLACPQYVALNRGNHECDYMNEEYGFDVEVSTKYDRNMYRIIQQCFCALPLATIIGKKVFVVHGGLPRRKEVRIEDISRIYRFKQIPIPISPQSEEDEIFQDLLWSDPADDIQGWRDSVRGAGVDFGADVTAEFLRNNGLDLVVRSHEECLSGYKEHHNGRLITVFSASDYTGPETNYGAFVVFVGDNPEPSFHMYQIPDDDMEGEAMLDLAETAAITTPTLAMVTPFNALSKNSRSAAGLRCRAKDDVMRVLRERIYNRRHRLLSYCANLDCTHKGSIWKIEWVEVMRNVLNLDLPWFFLRGYFVEEDDDTRIWYARFLVKYHNMLQPLWINEWTQSACSRLAHQQRMNHHSQYVTIGFKKDKVDYNEFCSVIRSIDYTISETQLFHLFMSNDENGIGHIDGPMLVQKLTNAGAHPSNDPLRWDLDVMEQLQSVVVQGRTQLAHLFKVNSKDRVLGKEKFMAGLEQLGRGMRKQLTQPQREKIYEFMSERAPQSAVTFDQFVIMTAVFDCALLPRDAVLDFLNLNLAAFCLKNSSFASVCRDF